MKKYQNNKSGFKAIKKRALWMLIPLMAGAFYVGVGMPKLSNPPQGAANVNTLPYVLALGLGVMVFGIFRGLSRQRQIFESYTLTLTADAIQREQLYTKKVVIDRADVRRITRTHDGGFIIRGKNRTDLIGISRYVDHPEDLELELRQIREIEPEPFSAVAPWVQVPLALASLALVAVVIISERIIFVLPAASILIVFLIWSLFQIQTSKNVDKRVKRNFWLVIIVVLSLIGIVFTKL